MAAEKCHAHEKPDLDCESMLKWNVLGNPSIGAQPKTQITIRLLHVLRLLHVPARLLHVLL